ncbi:MAG: hypothetical protein IJT50_00335 [Lentisphaeria bacterium]|nr:hypothetical protein [Lentisphaeria bacterium]
MDDREMERRLGEFDFSRFSPEREPLLQKLLFLHRSSAVIEEESNDPWAKRLDDEALDDAVAAGNPAAMGKPKDKK